MSKCWSNNYYIKEGSTTFSSCGLEHPKSSPARARWLWPHVNNVSTCARARKLGAALALLFPTFCFLAGRGQVQLPTGGELHCGLAAENHAHTAATTSIQPSHRQLPAGRELGRDQAPGSCICIAVASPCQSPQV